MWKYIQKKNVKNNYVKENVTEKKNKDQFLIWRFKKKTIFKKYYIKN